LFPGIGHGEQKALSDAHGHIFQSRFLNLVRPFPFASDLIHMLREAGKQVRRGSPSKFGPTSLVFNSSDTHVRKGTAEQRAASLWRHFSAEALQL
jgi:hypothetical protein